MRIHREQSYVRAAHNQAGAALIVALVMLLIITVLGIAATQSSLLGSKATRNERDREVAFQAAQAGLRDALNDIKTGPRRTLFTSRRGISEGAQGYDSAASGCTPASNPIAAGGPGLCIGFGDGPGSQPIYLARDLAATGSSAIGVSYGAVTGAQFASRQSSPSNLTLPARPPVYAIEQIVDTDLGSNSDSPPLFRITVMGFGVEDTQRVVLQAVYRVPNTL